MAEKSKFKNKQKCLKLLKREKLHAPKLPLLQYLEAQRSSAMELRTHDSNVISLKTSVGMPVVSLIKAL